MMWPMFLIVFYHEIYACRQEMVQLLHSLATVHIRADDYVMIVVQIVLQAEKADFNWECGCIL